VVCGMLLEGLGIFQDASKKLWGYACPELFIGGATRQHTFRAGALRI